MWTVKYDSKTPRVDADIFKYGEKNIRFRKYPATCGRRVRNRENNIKTSETFDSIF